jgi:glycosyltransferase involved in cell wall biosynthesis
MRPTPLFSIVIPVFNRAAVLGQALESVTQQDWEDYEVIVVDDGSNDTINDVLASYRALPITFLKNATNRGVAHARNRGVRAAQGSWIVFLDSDNRLLPGALTELHSTIAECDEKVAVVYGKSELIGDGLHGSGTAKETPRRWGYREYIAAMRIDEALPVARRDVLLRFPFEEELGTKRECGTLVWYAIGQDGRDFVWTREIVQQYRMSPDSLSGRPFLSTHPEEMVACNKKVLERFGKDLLRGNRKKFVLMQQKTSFYCLMANCRRCAVRHAWTAAQYDPLNLRSYALLFLCALSPRLVRGMYLRLAGIVA